MPSQTRAPIAVTGATGYIGGRLIGRLLAAGHAVRCLVRSPRKVEGRTWADDPRVQIVAVDLADGPATERALRGCAAAYWLSLRAVTSNSALSSFHAGATPLADRGRQVLRQARRGHDDVFGARGEPALAGSASLVSCNSRASGRARYPAVRPQGRDWFVRAGNTGGDGSKDKPFRDPFQALEKCQSGDSIHVAEGEYVGKMRAGRWKIEMPHIALLGGYDANFTERAPWTHPTRLLCPQDFKGTRGGVTLEGDSDHTGTIIDGFVFDKRLNNNYGPDLNLIDQFTDHSQHLTLNRPDCVVRNCIFVNGAEGAINVANGQLVENNVFMNHVGHAISIRGGHTPAPITVRNNTILFNWERAGRFGAGRGYGGEGIAIESQVRATIDGNIVQFSDNNAIRFNADPKDVRLTNNVFAHNLWAILYKTENIVDDATFGMLGDFGLAASTGNRLLVPGIALDTAWFDLYLKRTAYVPGKVQMEDWNKLREILGEPLLATGGVAGSCRAPAYDWQKTLQMVPKNPECTAGARPFRVEAKFTGIVREEVAQEYTETPWNTAKRADTWAALDGKRVSIKVGIQSTDANFRLADIKKEDYDCYSIIGPEGIDGGLPMNCYVKRGTPADRALRNAKMGSRGAPEQLYVLSGVARQNRTLVVEAASRAD